MPATMPGRWHFERFSVVFALNRQYVGRCVWYPYAGAAAGWRQVCGTRMDFLKSREKPRS